MERWRGRVALVTGASTGIGAAISRSLVAAGVKVVGVARNVENIRTMANELAKEPGTLTPFTCDLKKDTEVLSMFAWIKKELGGIDICINNAGMSKNYDLLSGTPEVWREMLDVNVVALCLCTKKSIESMKERGVDDGHVIHISSIAGHMVVPKPNLHFYAATKFAVNALVEALRQELTAAKSHIRVTSISPGLVETKFSYKMYDDPSIAQNTYSSITCLKPDDIAASVIHALSAPPHAQIQDILIRPTEEVYQ